jgi:hypothetical protein
MRRSVTLVAGLSCLVAVVVAIRTLTPPGPAAAPVLTVTSDGTTITDAIQAEWMQHSLVDYMAWPWAHALLWFTWTDYSPDNMWGLVRLDNSHRPSFDVYKAFIAANKRP